MKKFIGKCIFKMLGWKVTGERPKIKKYVMLAVPHTTNWDGLLLLAACFQFDMKISWMIKDSALKVPILGWMLRRTGAVAINRSKNQGVVDQMVAKFQKFDEFVLAIPPEGTRSYCDYWKTGFYAIAKKANVSIVPGYLNYKTKIAGFGQEFMPTEVKVDMDKLRKFYKNIVGKYPEKISQMRLKIEKM